MKKSEKTYWSIGSKLFLLIAFSLFVSFLAITACNDDDDDDDDSDTDTDDDDDDEGDFGCSNPEAEECNIACNQERSDCYEACGISPVDEDDPCGIFGNSDNDGDDGEVDWSDNPEMEQFCECLYTCSDEGKDCYSQCDELCE